MRKSESEPRRNPSDVLRLKARPFGLFWALTSNERLWLLSLLVLALLVRVSLVVNLERLRATGEPNLAFAVTDGWEYHHHALNILEGRDYGEGYETRMRRLYRPPLYSFFMAGVYWLLGPSFDGVLLMQSLVGAATCLAIYGLARRLFGGRVAVLSTAIAAVYPFFLINVGTVSTEPLFALLFVSALWGWMLLHDRPTLGRAATTGVLIGLAALTRETALALLPLAGTWLLATTRQPWRSSLIALAAVSVCTVAVILPWSVRNYLAEGRPVLVSTSGPFNLYINNSEWGVKEYWRPRQGDEPDYMPLLFALMNVHDEAWFYGRSWDFIRGEPEAFARLVVSRVSLFWNLAPREAHSPIRWAAGLLVLSAVPMAGLMGLLLSLRHHARRTSLFLLLAIAWTAIHGLSFGNWYYRAAPVDGYLVIFAAYALLVASRYLVQLHRQRFPKSGFSAHPAVDG